MGLITWEKGPYTLKRRYLQLDRENQRFSIIRDEEIKTDIYEINEAFSFVIDSLNASEGTEGIVSWHGLSVDDMWPGFYAIPNGLPLLGYFRTHQDGDIVDYIFFPEGGYNGEYERYLYLDGVLFKGPFALMDWQDINEYGYIFPKETIEITSWETVDRESLKAMLTRHSDIMLELLEDYKQRMSEGNLHREYEHYVNYDDALLKCPLEFLDWSRMKEFADIFPKRTIEIIRWDSINVNLAGQLLLPYKNIMETLLEAVQQDNINFQRLEREICIGRQLANMIDLFRAVINNDPEFFDKVILPKINEELLRRKSNAHKSLSDSIKPLSLLWKDYLEDVLHALMFWEEIKRNGREPKTRQL